ncbi:holo-ACP synthase [Agrococcus carbonis]|uniref:Holo-[acyl-carrier-protein] synthase n=1 Tax=Agrococcus carbonis TaxID=684552 RepID=A0A1H1QU75_9MICO|nr:holo-ACP synthase [Agrococcus carbonis]SDS27058.1 holo-[acyl-carrier protein] synthase [Agrococcus carbonis]
MILGLGVDVVDLARFERAVSRTPRLRERLFAPEELLADGEPRSLPSLAARFAAKEAAQKAIGTTSGARWTDYVVLQAPDGKPRLELRGAAAEHARAIGAASLHVSMSHDAGIATATVIAES